ncbi:phenylalanine--tRNA ligase subunit beta [Geobacter sp. AOG2]|uniref:phenylalanine--tRNA ligase subunit beta n=1 Tax=Geobacter sp. AOG2 TaxID=1566347 RepID=UPI001CC3D082|nr:phenylalanine--tRNA ligase subunit beta [Geobacter sp. AOG2]GFE60774.1 phenylalanine-tRNA ligase beta subunit [Geobacter sp. AOG2]
MNVTYNWLKEFVDFDLTPDQLADLLTMLGLEVERMEKLGEGMDDVVVAVVEEKRQHPNADKLSLCRVNNGTEVLDVVCGAQNFKQGDTVALAKIGATLPGDFKIKRSKIRGEESCGMLCSEKELGLAAESAGIMVLNAGLTLGTPVFAALGLKDTLFEIGLTPNRADCLSVVGVAREIAAKLGKKVRCPEIALNEAVEPVDKSISVTIEDAEYCPRYAARYLGGCRIAPSPEWLVKRLNAIGVRSINNVVDVTNLVMMELGQPLHAFDCDRLARQRIVVRRAGDGELFTTLDSQQRILSGDDLVICDAERPVALAGIMGGENSEIADTTTNILLESAWFLPSAIRKTSKRLGLHTESSHRFERGVDIGGVTRALDRAAALIGELAGGRVAKGCLDVYPGKREPAAIPFRPERANALIGIELPHEEIIAILERLECAVGKLSTGALTVTPPSYRIDIEREVDLVEEIARMNGFDRIPATLPRAQVVSDRPTRHQQMEKSVRDALVEHGMNEIINFSFTAPGAADKLLLAADDPRRSTIRLANPLVDEQSVMRTTLLPGVLETVARNVSFRSLDLKLFEMRRVYLPSQGDDMPREPLYVVGALTGSRDGLGWSRTNEPVDFYDAKGIMENLLDLLGVGNVKWVADTPDPFYHPGKSCSIMAGRERIGSVGELHPTVQENFGLDKPVYCFELDFEKVLILTRQKRTISAPSRFPDSTRDIAMLAPVELPVEKIIECIHGVKAKEVEKIDIFDLYLGNGIPEGCKSVAIRIRYRSYERTLTDDEIGKLHGKIVDTLVNKVKVSIR